MTKKRKPPSVQAVEALGQGHHRLMEVAQILGVSESTMRRWLKEDSLHAPTYQIAHGEMITYVYTDADIEELRGFMHAQPRPELRDNSDKR